MANRALLIGINNYLRIGDLNGCINDVWNMRDLLVRTFEYLPENISLLVDSSATKDRIKDRVNWLFNDVGDGDNLVFHFSGHGSFIRDFSGDETERVLEDQADELICLYDMDWRDEKTYLIDDDLGAMFKALPAGATLKVVLDSCHSGTGTRNEFGPPPDLAPVTGRAVPITVNVYGGSPVIAPREGWTNNDNGGGGYIGSGGGGGGWAGSNNRDAAMASLPPLAQPRFFSPPADILARSVNLPPNARKRIGRSDEAAINHVLFAGCRDDQTSADAFIDGDYNGAFTYFFAKTARQYGVRGTLKELIDRVSVDLQYGGFSQIPQLEGATKNQTFMGS